MNQVKAKEFIKISFSVQGYVEQLIEPVDGVTGKELLDKINNGEACTTIIENGEVIEVETDRVLGKVTYIETENLEYLDYQLG